MWKNLFNRDNYLFGILLGIILPALFYAALLLLDYLVVLSFDAHMMRKQEYLLLLGITINLFPIKYYFANLKYDKTGRGVLVMTFVETILFFVLS
jgi:hypothetical protein